MVTNGQIPLVCGQNEEKAQAVGTFWTYATGATVLDCKGLVVKGMQGASNDDIQEALAVPCRGAMKNGNWSYPTA